MNDELRTLAGYVQWAESRIIKTMNDNGLTGRLLNGQQTAQLLVWTFEVHTLSKSAVDRAMALQNALDVALGTQGTRVGRLDGLLSIEVPSPLRRAIPARALPPGRRTLRVALGRDLTNRPWGLDFRQTPHLLVVGATQVGGKSEFLRALVWSLARQSALGEASFLLVDLKAGQALAPFNDLAHAVHPVITRADEAARAVRWLIGEMDYRLAEGVEWPHIFLVVDEIYRLAQEWPEADTHLGRLAAVSRGASVHLVAATQRVSRETLSTSMVASNVVDRLVGRVDNAQSSALALTVPQAGAERLLGNGDMLAWVGGRLGRVQVAQVSEKDMRALPQGAGRLRLEELEPEVATVAQRGGHNKVALQDEWVEHFRRGGSLYQAMRPPDEGGLGLSSSVAYRAQEAQRRNGGGP